MAETWRRVLLLVVAALAATARAEDPPAPKPKPLKASPRAQAAIDAYRNAVYDAAKHGLTSMTSTLVPVGLPSRARPRCKFAAPAEFRVTVPQEFRDDARRAGVAHEVAKSPLTNVYFEAGLFEWNDSSVDLVEKDGGRVLVVRTPAEGDVTETYECALDAAGLVTRLTRSGAPGSAASDWTIRFSWGKAGDENCIVGTDTSVEGDEPFSYSCVFRYADVRGIHLPVSYDVSYVAGKAEPWKFTFYIDDLVVNGAKIELPTPWKHVNVVSPEAKSAIERFSKLVYRPEDHGLKSVFGVLIPIGFRSLEPGMFKFSPPGQVRVLIPPAIETEMRDGKMWRWPFVNAFYAGYHASAVFDCAEYDATAVKLGDGDAVTLVEYSDGKRSGTDEFELDAEGLVRRRTHRAEADSDSNDFTADYEWAVHVGLRCVSGLDIAVAGANPARYACRLNYADVAGVHLLASYEIRYSANGAETKTFTVHVDDLEVNGAKIALPKAWIHANVVSSDAEAAIEKYMALTYRPAEHGLKSAAGVIVSNLADAQGRIDFKFEPPAAVASSIPKDMRESQALLFVKLPLELAWKGMPLPAATEYDADVVVKDGRRTLVVTTFYFGKKVATTEFGLDDDGLVRTVRRNAESAMLLTWSGGSGRRRIERIAMESPVPKGTGRVVCSLVYADVDGLQLPASYSVEGTLDGARQYLISARVEDLVVNGKKVDVPKPDWPTSDGRK